MPVYLRERPTEITSSAVVEALSNDHARRILALTQDRPMDAQDIMEATGIPKSTVYRQVNRLQELGLLRIETGALRAGHAVDRYRATVAEATVSIQAGSTEVTWERRPRNEVDEDIWLRLRSGPPSPGVEELASGDSLEPEARADPDQ